MKEQKHKNQVKKLGKLENELINLISKTNDEILMDKFSEWQGQRAKCNKSYLDILIDLAKKKPIPQPNGLTDAEEKLFILDLLKLNKFIDIDGKKFYSEESVINIIKQLLKTETL